MGILDAPDMQRMSANSSRAMRDVVNRGIAGVLGGPVDLAAMALKPLGYDHPAPIGSSEWIGNLMQQAGMVSPQRYPLPEALISLVSPMGAISPVGKARLLADLQAGKGSGTYRLGDVTEGQLKALQSAGVPAKTRDVMMTDDVLEKLVRKRVNAEGFTPEEVVKFAEQAMAKRSRVDLDPGKQRQLPSLLNEGLIDPVTGLRYDARMPFSTLEDSLQPRSAIPDGLPPRTPPTPPKK